MGLSVWPAKGGGSGGSLYWGDAVATLGSLPASGVAVGELRQVIDTEIIYKWNGSAWIIYLDVAEVVLNAALNAHTGNTSNPHATTKAQVGLGNVDNTSDANKPVSTAQAAADSAVQAYAIQRSNHTGTQSAATITGLAAVATSGLKADVGLGNVDNTSDANKPVSTAQAAADSAALASAQTYTDGKITALLNAAPAALDTLDELAAALGDDPNFATTVSTALGNRLRVDTAAQGLNSTQKTNAKTNIDLNNVDNTSDATKNTAAAVLQNKDIDGGTATDARRITLPKDTFANIRALTRKQGTILFCTDLLRQLIDNGTTLDIIEKNGVNLISNPNDAQNWAASGAGVTVATTTTAAELPLSGVIASAIKITAVSGTDYARIRWTMPGALKNWKIPVSWYQLVESGYLSGDFKLDIYTNSASNYGGSYTRKTLSSDSSSVTSIPAGNGFFGQGAAVSFDAGNEDYYEMRITRVSGTKFITLANVKVGPGELGVVSPQSIFETVTSYTIGATTTPPTPGSGTTYYRQTIRDGADAIIRYEVRQTNAGSAGSGDYLFPLPTGLTIDYSRVSTLGVTNAGGDVGSGSLVSGSTNLMLRAYAINSGSYANKIYCAFYNDSFSGTMWSGSGAAFSNTTTIASFTVRVPIAEWAGSVSTGPVPAEQFLSNSGTWDNTDSTSFQSGWATITGSLTALRTKRVRSAYPIQQDDEVVLEFRESTTSPPLPANKFASSAGVRIGDPYIPSAAGTLSGCYYQSVSGSLTDIDVVFAQYTSQRGDGTNQTNWVNGWQWRVRITRKASLPFANAGRDGSAGLYKAGQAPGVVTGVAIATGDVGEVVEITTGATQALTTNAAFNVSTMNVPAGRWKIEGGLFFNPGDRTGNTYVQAGLNTVPATLPSNYLTTSISTNNGSAAFSVMSLDVNFPGPGTTPVYLVMVYNFSGGAPGTSSGTPYMKRTRMV